MGLVYEIDLAPIATLRRKADFVFMASKVALFQDGCFWHGCSDHRTIPKSNEEWWRAKLQRTRQRDQETTRFLQAAGWTVIRAWEHDTPADVARHVAGVIRERTSSTTQDASGTWDRELH